MTGRGAFQEQLARTKAQRRTHSCHPCRVRKIRCTYEQGVRACRPCSDRGLQCVPQDNGVNAARHSRRNDTEQTTEARLRSVEGNVQKILQTLQSGNTSALIEQQVFTENDAYPSTVLSASINSAPHPSHSILPSPSYTNSSNGNYSPGPDEGHENAPIFNLFDSFVLKEYQKNQLNDRSKRSTSTSRHPLTAVSHHLISSLRSRFPSIPDLRKLVHESGLRSDFWEVHLPNAPLSESCATKEDMSRRVADIIWQSLNSEDTGLVGKVLLSLALCMQQLPSESTSTGSSLFANSKSLESEFISIAEFLISLDENFLRTVDGIECLALAAKYHVNLGRPRRAWVLFQQAISFAHLLGFHYLDPTSKDAKIMQRSTLWMKVWLGERQLALLLCLPTSTSNNPLMVQRLSLLPHMPYERKVWLKIGDICGKLIARNQYPQESDWAMTMALEQELESCRASIPLVWWDAPLQNEMSSSAIESEMLARIMYHNTRKLTHMPFMVRAFSDARFEYNRVAALESSREMLKMFNTLQESMQGALTVCNVLDFQVFTAAMVLLVNLLASTWNSDNDKSSKSDLGAIRQIIRLFEQISLGRGCMVASQARKVLQDLSDAYCSPFSSTGVYQVIIPYFGQIELACRSKGSTPPAANDLIPTAEDAIVNEGWPSSMGSHGGIAKFGPVKDDFGASVGFLLPFDSNKRIDQAFGSTDLDDLHRLAMSEFELDIIWGELGQNLGNLGDLT